MSTTEAEVGSAVSCPSCGAAVASEQGWCLECGHALRRRPVTSSPARGRPGLLPLLGAALAGAVLALVVASLLSRSEDPAERAAGPQPAATAPAAPPATTPAEPATTPTETGADAAQPPAGAPLWPADLEAYTVVLMSSTSPADAARRARALGRNGADAGVLLSDDYENFPRGQWVVWRGRYRDRDKAEEALALIERAGRDGYVTFVRRRS